MGPQEIISKLKQRGVSNPQIIDAAERIVGKKADVDVDQVLFYAKLIQLAKPKNIGNALVLGQFPEIFFFLLGGISQQIYTSEKNQEEITEKVESLQKKGFGNIHVITPEETDKYMPYRTIFIKESTELEPHFFIKMTVPGGTLLIARYTETNEVIKITKTKTGFIREDYAQNFAE